MFINLSLHSIQDALDLWHTRKRQGQFEKESKRQKHKDNRKSDGNNNSDYNDNGLAIINTNTKHNYKYKNIAYAVND